MKVQVLILQKIVMGKTKFSLGCTENKNGRLEIVNDIDFLMTRAKLLSHSHSLSNRSIICSHSPHKMHFPRVRFSVVINFGVIKIQKIVCAERGGN
jgi:hypothetical protein